MVEGAALEMLCTQVPRVRIPDSPPSRVFITDSSCEHSIFLFQLYFRAGVMPALFACYGQFFISASDETTGLFIGIAAMQRKGKTLV